jgi:nucleoside-diphosphate-sugar epimerase
LLDILGLILEVDPDPIHTEPRPGDVRHTRADVSAAGRDLGHVPRVGFREGLDRTVEWFVGERAWAAG